MNAYELLRDISFFNDLDGDALEALAQKARIKTFSANEQVVSQSERIKAFFIVISGRVKIFRSNTEGKEQILYLVEDGQPFCFCTAFNSKPYPVNVTALEETCIAHIPAADMEEFARKEPNLMLKVVQILSSRLLEAMNLVESLALQRIKERVAYYLLQAEAGSDGEMGEAYTLQVSHREMSKILGTTPETLSRIIQKFKRSRVIEASGRTIRILNRKELELMSKLP